MAAGPTVACMDTIPPWYVEQLLKYCPRRVGAGQLVVAVRDFLAGQEFVGRRTRTGIRAGVSLQSLCAGGKRGLAGGQLGLADNALHESKAHLGVGCDRRVPTPAASAPLNGGRRCRPSLTNRFH